MAVPLTERSFEIDGHEDAMPTLVQQRLTVLRTILWLQRADGDIFLQSLATI